MVTLRIFMIGLIALVPDSGKGKLAVVLQEMRQGSHVHYPVVIYKCSDDLSGSPCGIKADDELRRKEILNVSPDFGARLLSGEQIRVIGGEDGKIEFAPGRSRSGFEKMLNRIRGDVPQFPAEGNDFSWLPRMADISPSHGIIASRHLENPSANEIAGVLVLRNLQGRVSTFGFVDVGCEIYSFTFKESASTVAIMGNKQALPDVTLLEIPLKGKEVSLTFTDFSGEPGQPLVLSRNEGGNIDIVLGNLPPYLPLDCSDPHATSDEHFEYYYRLSDAPAPSRAKIPFIGMMKVFNEVGETPSALRPEVVKFVEADVCLTAGICRGPNPSSSNRPICTQVVLDPGSQ